MSNNGKYIHHTQINGTTSLPGPNTQKINSKVKTQSGTLNEKKSKCGQEDKGSHLRYAIMHEEEKNNI